MLCMRSILPICLLAFVALTTVSAANEFCSPPGQIQALVLLQTSGRSGTLSDDDLHHQAAFANMLTASINQLNDHNNYYPGFQPLQLDDGLRPRKYQSNQATTATYDDSTFSFPGDDFGDLGSWSADGSLSGLSVSSSATPDLANAFTSARTTLNGLSTAPTFPHTSVVRVLVIVNDGQATDFVAARCAATTLLNSGVHIIHVRSKRSYLPDQVEVPTFASVSKKGYNQDGSKVTPLDFEFHSFDELLEDRILHGVSAAIRNLAAPGRASAPACVVSGDPHFTTFDGLHFDYNGVGDYYLFRSLRQQDPLTVQYRAGSCAAGSSCALGAAISDGIDTVEVIIADRTGNPKNAYITFNGAKVPLADFSSLDESQPPTQAPNVNITTRMLGTESYQVTVRFAVGHTLKIQKNLITVLPAPHLYGRSVGLCGNWNGCPVDDLLDSCGNVGAVNTSDSFAAARFGDSWTVAPQDSLFSTPPPQGVSAWEVSNNEVCLFQPTAWVRTPTFTRWPLLPAQERENTVWAATSPSIPLFPQPSVAGPNAAGNNLGLVSLKPHKLYTAFNTPTACVRLRGALQQDCIADSAAAPDTAEASLEVLWQACTEYCATGRLFTNLVTSSDCIAAQLCALGAVQPDLHQDYSTKTGVLPAVTFGNPNTPETFFQPTLGLSGRYFLEVAEADLCGVSRKIQAVDINCATETPQVVLSFPGLTSAAKEGAEKTSVDPLVEIITSIVPDVNAGYPIVTIAANVFPQSTLLGHSWKVISAPVNDTFGTPVGFPELQGAQAGRVRFTPRVTGEYVLEYAVWTGCTVSRARALVYAACSVAPPSAAIQPRITGHTNGDEPINDPFTSAYRRGNNVALTWVGPDRFTVNSASTTSVHSPSDATPYVHGLAESDALKNRWSAVALTSTNTFDVDSPPKNLRFKWSLLNVNATADSLGLKFLREFTEYDDAEIWASSNGAGPTSGGCDANGNNSPAPSTINSEARAHTTYLWNRQGRVVYEFGRLPTADLTNPASTLITSPTEVDSTSITFERLRSTATFGASAGYPAGSVAPFTNLYNAYRRVTTEVSSISSYGISNVTKSEPEVLCRVILDQTHGDDAGDPSKATLYLEEVGDLPKAFDDAHKNWCQAALYQVQLQVQDECQSSTDVITLEPTCDGYVEAVLQCDQTIFWDPVSQQFPTAKIDGSQSFDEMYNSPDGWDPSFGNFRSAIPSNRRVIYKWSVDAPTGVPNGLVSQVTQAGGFTPSAITSNAQFLTADVPGKYKVGLQVSNRCAVSEKATSTVHFSCYGAPPCNTTIDHVVSAGVDVLPYVSVDYTPTSTVANLVVEPLGENQLFQQVRLSSGISTIGANVYTVVPRHRLVVVSAPAGSKYFDVTEDAYRKIGGWKLHTAELTFRADVAGDYVLAVQITYSCGCDVHETRVGVTARCLLNSADRLDILINLDNPSVYQPQTVGTPLTISSSTASTVKQWTLTAPNGVVQTTILSPFVFTPALTGTYTLTVDANDGCKSLTNTTSFSIIAAPDVVVPQAPDCTLTFSKANAVVIDATGTQQEAATADGAVTATFRNQALPKVTLAAVGGFEHSDQDYSQTIIEWTVTQAPEGSIYHVGTTWEALTSTRFDSTEVDYSNYKYDPLTNTNKYTVKSSFGYLNTSKEVKEEVIIPFTTVGVPAFSSNLFGANDPAQWQPDGYATSTIRAYSQLHSQVCLTLDRPGLYRFKLTFKNGTDATSCPSEDEVYFKATCSASIPVLTVTTTPASPTIDSFRPLRVSLAASATDLDADDGARLTYSWVFVKAPALSTQPFNARLYDRKEAKNYTQTSVELSSPNENSDFPPLFNPHTKNAHFLALAPGNYTLLASVSDGCNTVTQPVIVIVGCAGRNSYGSLENPIVPSEETAQIEVDGAVNTNSFTITDATNGAVAISSTAGSGDIQRVLATQWRIVGFEPAYDSATLQSSRESRGLESSSFDKIVSGSNGAEVDNSSSGLSHSGKLGLAIALPIIGGILIIAALAWFILKKKAVGGGGSSAGPKVHDVPVSSSQQPVELGASE